MATFRRQTITLLDQCRSINVCHYLSVRTIEGALLISRCCFVSPSFSGFPCTWLRRSAEKSFKKISFHAYKNERMGLIRRRGNGGKNKRERFLIVCLHERICERACGNGGNFSFFARVFFLTYSFSCIYGGRGWCRSISLPGSNPRPCRSDLH